MIRPFAIAFLLALHPATAWSQGSFCYRPAPPYPFEPPRDDPGFYAFINEQYQRYLVDMQDYINCLNEEQHDAFEESQHVLQRWLDYFGDDAVMTIPFGR